MLTNRKQKVNGKTVDNTEAGLPKVICDKSHVHRTPGNGA